MNVEKFIGYLKKICSENECEYCPLKDKESAICKYKFLSSAFNVVEDYKNKKDMEHFSKRFNTDKQFVDNLMKYLREKDGLTPIEIYDIGYDNDLHKNNI